jgi:hypothetical protein
LKDAVAGHVFTEPVRWQKPNVLVLDRHEYYGVKKPMTIDGQTFDTMAISRDAIKSPPRSALKERGPQFGRSATKCAMRDQTRHLVV